MSGYKKQGLPVIIKCINFIINFAFNGWGSLCTIRYASNMDLCSVEFKKSILLLGIIQDYTSHFIENPMQGRMSETISLLYQSPSFINYPKIEDQTIINNPRLTIFSKLTVTQFLEKQGKILKIDFKMYYD